MYTKSIYCYIILKNKQNCFITVKEENKLSRQERKNMITFIERMKGMDRNALLYMTDAEIEHIYNSAYSLSEEGRDF